MLTCIDGALSVVSINICILCSAMLSRAIRSSSNKLFVFQITNVNRELFSLKQVEIHFSTMNHSFSSVWSFLISFCNWSHYQKFWAVWNMLYNLRCQKDRAFVIRSTCFNSTGVKRVWTKIKKEDSPCVSACACTLWKGAMNQPNWPFSSYIIRFCISSRFKCKFFIKFHK